MKAHLKFILYTAVNAGLFYLAYMLTFLLNDMYNLATSYNEELIPHIYYLIAIKVFTLVLFMLYQTKKYSYIRASLGILAGNILSLLYLMYLGSTINSYTVFGLNVLIDLFLLLALVLIFNLISGKVNHEEEEADINKYMQMKKDLEEIALTISSKKEELNLVESMIEKKEEELSEVKEEAKEKRSFIPANTIELQSISCPVRIEIGDKSKCIGAVYATEKGKEDKGPKSIVDEKIVANTINEMKKREEELDERAKRIEKKEEIIEKTITNLEQISKTIKDRMRLLDEKESYLNKQKEIIEKKEDEFSTLVHNEIYETIFSAPDITENEIKIKDKCKEIIINKDDLSEIRQLIEKAEVE